MVLFDMKEDLADRSLAIKILFSWLSFDKQTEEEIQTLRQVLASKTKHAQELKRKLGISAWKEWTNDLGQGVKNLQETSA